MFLGKRLYAYVCVNGLFKMVILYQKKMPRSTTSYFPLTQHLPFQNIFEYIYLTLYSQMLFSKPRKKVRKR